MKKNAFVLTALLSLLICITLMLSSCADIFERSEIGVINASINSNGELVLTYSNGLTQNVGKVVGENGKDGIDGEDGKDGKDGINGINGLNGKDGENGKDGANGKDGELIIKNEGSDLSLSTAKAMRSSVSIVCKFAQSSNGAGSGVIYRYDASTGSAFIITNYHVVYDATYGICSDINVFLYGAEYLDTAIPATYIGGSQNYDIAIIRVENSDLLKNSPAVAVDVFDSNNVSVGEEAFAIGNPSGSGIAVSSGVISVDSESITMTAADDKTSVTYRVMRTDTPINPGNSGGGLYNKNGELIGIVNAKMILSSVEGIGYAIPSTLACNVADNIIDNCYGTTNKSVLRPLLGITITISESKSVYDPTAGTIRIEETVVVDSVNETSILYNQLLAQDIIIGLSIEDVKIDVSRQYQIIDFMLTARIGDSGIITVIRNGETVELPFYISSSCISVY